MNDTVSRIVKLFWHGHPEVAKEYENQVKAILSSGGVKQQFVEWDEPFGPIGEPIFCRTLLRTAIAYQRWKKEQNGQFMYKSDEDALKDFITDHWARIILI